MNILEKKCTQELLSFDNEDKSAGQGMHDWAVPWADLMMVMFVLFVVLFVYANSHQDVRILFSAQSAEKAEGSRTLDPLIGLIGQISSRTTVGSHDREQLSMTGTDVLYRNRKHGISVIQEKDNRVRIVLRGALFFDAGEAALNPDATMYLREIAEIVKLSVGAVHVIGYTAEDEESGARSFVLSSGRAAQVADAFISELGIDPKRMTITGRGAYSPELPSTSPKNNEMNRRVEIYLTNER